MNLENSNQEIPQAKDANLEEEKQKENAEKSNAEFQAKKEAVAKDVEAEENKKLERNLKGLVDTFGGQSKVMLDALHERQQAGFTPLLPPDKFQGMVMHIKNIKNLEGKFDLSSVEEINLNIMKLTALISDIGIQQMGGQIRENPQNLEKLAMGAKIFASSVEESARNLPIEMIDKQKEEKSKELLLSLQKLSEQAQRLYIFSSKLRESFR